MWTRVEKSLIGVKSVWFTMLKFENRREKDASQSSVVSDNQGASPVPQW